MSVIAAVDVGAVRQQRLDDAHPVDVDRNELIADVPVGDVHGGLQRLAQDIAAPLPPSESRSVVRELRGILSSIGLARTPCTVSSVDPPSAFGSAPLSSSKSTRSSWPLMIATSNGVARSGRFRVHVRARRQQRAHGSQVALAHREQERRRSAVGPRVDVGAGDRSAPARPAPCPAAAAHISAVCPFQVSFALTSAPALSSTFTASTFPVRAASISGVSPARTSAVRIGAAPSAAAR